MVRAREGGVGCSNGHLPQAAEHGWESGGIVCRQQGLRTAGMEAEGGEGVHVGGTRPTTSKRFCLISTLWAAASRAGPVQALIPYPFPPKTSWRTACNSSVPAIPTPTHGQAPASR